MPVYGQPTEFNDRLSSLMSCMFCNSNDLYNGIDQSVKIPPNAKYSYFSSTRPLFTEAILRKATKLEEFRLKSKSLAGAAITETTIVLEVVLVADEENSVICKLLADIISRLFAMPEDHSNNFLLEVTTVRSHAIREDLTVAQSSRSLLRGDSTGGIQRRIFVGLGSALQGLCLYLCQEETIRLRSQCPRDTEKLLQSLLLSSVPEILAVICVDPPPHLWKSCGRFLLDQTSRKGIPSLFVGYTENDEGVERIYACLGELLNDCKRHPHALVLVAKDSAKILRRPISTPKDKIGDDNNNFDASFWLARLITKYAESIQRIRTPPRWWSAGTTPRMDEEPGRSML